MKNNKILLAAAFGILFVVYNIIIFITATDTSGSFWVSYAFTVIAFIVQIISLTFFFWEKNKDRSAFNSLPFVIVSVFYFIVQLIAGSIFMLLTPVGIKALIIVQIVILSAYLIVAILTLIGKNIIETSENKTEDKIMFIDLLENDVITLKGKTQNPAVIEHLEKLREMIHYSDPISNTSLALIEQKISRKVDNLNDIITTDNIETIGKAINEIQEMLADRNRKCKIMK